MVKKKRRKEISQNYKQAISLCLNNNKKVHLTLFKSILRSESQDSGRTTICHKAAPDLEKPAEK